MKIIIPIVLTFFLVVGCNGEVEVNDSKVIQEEKQDYLVYKSELKEQENFTKQEDLPCDIISSIDRINEEEVSYRIILDKPKENMNNVKALIIHNYFTEDIFPSIGIFDEPTSLLVDSQDVRGIQLVGYIKTTKDISDINLELRIWVSYVNDNGEKKDIYYKPTK